LFTGSATMALVVVGAYLYFRDREPSSLLSERDSDGNKFELHQATSFCAEDEYSRLARDIVICTATNKFLLKKWGGGGHRAQASYGNAFGTFFYRPPKNIPASDGDVKFAVPMWDTKAKGWLLTFAIDGIGPKNRELAALFGVTAKEAMLESALTSEVKCYVMPSSSQSTKSSIAAPMTVLVSFLQHDEISLVNFPDYVWASSEQAFDPGFNVHAGVIASHCLESGIASWELLKKHGWTEDEMLSIKLPTELQTCLEWGSDVATVFTSMKKLLLKDERLPAPRPRRTCEPLGQSRS